MKSVRMHRKYAIQTNFLDTMLEHDTDIQEGETKLDAYRRGLKELDQIAAELRREQESMRGQTIQDARNSYPHVHVGVQQGFPQMAAHTHDGIIPVISKDKEPEERRIGVIASDIESCDSVKVLESYRLLAIASTELQEAYKKRMNELLAERPNEFTEGFE